MSDIRRVLVIDDSAVARQVLTNILSEDDILGKGVWYCTGCHDWLA
ncbi:MAG: hypothetical protein Ct9H300mP14_06680 [Gammaproteobacteria bacterium]|nr:MAG: hypothetical protein Ct9H300mP14_06680 [Gammaproteobacteria bacterium]